MTRKSLMVLALGVMGPALLILASAMAQPEARTAAPGTLAVDALAPHTRAPALFNHDAHNEKAKLEDCAVCHHDAKDGKIIAGVSSEGTPCADCHAVKGKATTLRMAYHRQCMGCHAARGNGPTACGSCHSGG